MSSSSNRSMGAWAEAERQRQRQLEAYQRQQRAAERELARSNREQQVAYRQRREAEAIRLTGELEARVESLSRLLAAGCRAPAFRTNALLRSEQLEPFTAGRLAVPVPMPNPGAYHPESSWGFGSGRRAQEEARSRYERDLSAARTAEERRQQQLTAYGRQYDEWRAAQLAEIRRHNAGIAEHVAGLRRGDPDTVVEYFSAALYASTAWPEGFPRQVSCAYDPAARRLVLNWELPGYDIVPAARYVRYLPSVDQDKETARPVGQRRSLYRDVLAQSVLLALRELFAADEFGTLDSVTLNGFVDDHDPSTGLRAQLFLATVAADRQVFDRLNLVQVSAVDCLVDGLGGKLSARPDQRTVVRPGTVPGDLGRATVSHGGGEDPDLFEMDPVEFESLVAELFRARGMQAVMTQRSNDGGVDVEALDPDPISGGTIIVQVKRYRHTVPPTAVRDLFGTVQGAGANKGVLVTTSGFGPGSYTFANGKPLTLISGTELVELLRHHGLRGRLGGGPATVPAQRTVPPASASAPEPEYNLLGMNWSGSVALDVCALVCRGNRALSDDHFVFFNNARTPDGAVRAVSRPARDKAAVRVAFDALPASADRLVLAVSIDPEINPNADLAGFTDSFIRLSDGSGAELDRLEVSDGRAGETALILGSFRRRSSGDWEFVIGGKGYEGGLEALVREYGIDVG
ncbi:restriction endonuclease [Streptomyces sp. H39-S7]|uniref:restriction endonuclease n=1 Tax=Streptomyces sp. H39-S7 TaxID=3004357 RepID=UPI0022AF2DC6|nr:restriction endonuclease [Streptomyces sp. H39-S7]MCZ4119449.1 restriction endonuclease [Streptomyces sp. H39-S7]